MKTFVKVVMVLFCWVLLQGTAGAVLGVADDVPGQDVVFPIICGVTTPLSTSWSIADVVGGAPDPMGNAAYADVILYQSNGDTVGDFQYQWTPFDVVTDNCQNLMNLFGPAYISSHWATTTIDGEKYYMGYLVVQQDSGSFGKAVVTNRFVGWVSLDDQVTGTGFKPFQAEGGVGSSFEEDGVPVTAKTLFFRFSIDNGASNNWWIVLTGIQPEPTRTAALEGTICDEKENCMSVALPVSGYLNVYSVNDVLPAPLFSAFPKTGFAAFNLLANDGDGPYTPDVSTFAWSYLNNCTKAITFLRPFNFKNFSPATICLGARKASMFPADRIYAPVFGIAP